MKTIRYGLIAVWLLCCAVPPATAAVSVSIGLPNVHIGINLPVFPELVRVPGYPVYYAPRMNANYFFYDGLYWVYQDDNWYSSSWYNGPWWLVEPYDVPLFILRVPVGYYRQPPVYFRGWKSNAPPRWGDHWGRDWERRRSGWNRWNRSRAPKPAPLPVFQQYYSGDRYPQMEQQPTLRRQHYRYEPRDTNVRQRFQQQEEILLRNQRREDRRPDTPVQQRREDDRRPDGDRSPAQRQTPDYRDRDQRREPDASQRHEQNRDDKFRGRGDADDKKGRGQGNKKD